MPQLNICSKFALATIYYYYYYIYSIKVHLGDLSYHDSSMYTMYQRVAGHPRILYAAYAQLVSCKLYTSEDKSTAGILYRREMFYYAILSW